MLEEDSLAHFRSAVFEPLRPALFFQVSLEDTTWASGDWHAFPAEYRKAPLQREAVLRELAPFEPVSVNVASDEELHSHPRWRGAFGHNTSSHVSFRWALCMDDIEALERRRGHAFRWVARLRPDLSWRCRLPAQLSLWPEAGVTFRQDFAVLLRRHATDVAMRQYPLAWGFAPCDGPHAAHPEFCGYLLALRSGAITRWTWNLADIRRPCSSSNGSWTGCDRPWQVQPAPVDDCLLRPDSELMGGPEPNASLAQVVARLFPQLAAESSLAFMRWAQPAGDVEELLALDATAAQTSSQDTSEFVHERCVYQGPRTPQLQHLSSKAAMVSTPEECGKLLGRDTMTFGLADGGECWFCHDCSFAHFGTVDAYNAHMCGPLGGTATIQVYQRRP